MKMEALWMETLKWFQSAAGVVVMNTWLSRSSDFKTGLDIHYGVVKEILSWEIWNENGLDCVDLALKLYQSMAEPGGLPSVGSHRVGHDWSNTAAAATAIRRTSLVAQMVKNPPAMQETWVQSLSWEDPLEESMATHSILAWTIPMDRRAWWATVHRVAQSRTWLGN